MSESEVWQELREVTPERQRIARLVLDEIRRGVDVLKATRRHPLPEGGLLPKSAMVAVYKHGVATGEWPADPGLLARIRMKPVRTLSGVTTVTVLTKPYPCPGKCVFCPTDARMPKSYLPDEPGAMRGLQNEFDPYRQVRSRLTALENTGHPTDKIELLILGGTWSAYRRDYQEWFVKRCFDAMNEAAGRDAPTEFDRADLNAVPVPPGALEEAHRLNETAAHRCVGLVIETRPDEIDPRELAWLRRLGVTKVQMGAQSLDDRVLALNKRGHTAAETLQAVNLLRAAGFKIVLHWMPNLLGATPASDRADFARLWGPAGEPGSGGYCPDEIKIYPCQLLANAELYEYWQRGEYTPYTQDELIHLIADVKPTIPRYVRVNRVIRDIPSTNVVEGNKRTSLRMDVFEELARRGQTCACIRCREVKEERVERSALRLVDLTYPAGGGLPVVEPPAGAEETRRLPMDEPSRQPEEPHSRPAPELAASSGGNAPASTGYAQPSPASPQPAPATAEEHFLQFVTPEDKIAGYLRLSLPSPHAPQVTGALPDLAGAAIIREIHVYGQSLAVGEEQPGAAQHSGLGTRLIEEAERIAQVNGYAKLAVIAAIGTRLYYEKRGFERGELYMVKGIRHSGD